MAAGSPHAGRSGAETDESAHAIPVCRWPDEPPPPDARLFVLALWGEQPREVARRAIRQAACEALAQHLGVPFSDLQLAAPRGEVPRVLLRGAGFSTGLNFSHEPGLSTLAVNLDGPIGLDVLRDETPPDWQAVAHDYLGDATLQRLRRTDGQGFAQAWADHEARLKCLGLALQEWTPDLATRIAPLRSRRLDLPQGWAGAIAWAG